MTIIVFSDIDDTLIQSKRKCLDIDIAQVTATNKDSKSSSFSTIEQLHLYNWFNNENLIPVTGRGKEAFERISLSFNSYKVINHGAIILNKENVLDEEWNTLIKRETQRWGRVLQQYFQELLDFIDQRKLVLRCRLVDEFGYKCYISIKGNHNDLLKLSTITERFLALPDNTRLHFNDQNMALLPPYACKKRAVEFLQEKHRKADPNTLFIGVGDSNSDLNFMSSCHFQMLPTNSQINREKLQ